MKEKILKNLLIFINGFAVGMLFYSRPKIEVIDIVMYILSGVTFLWYGRIKK
jgi:hypothetical protein